jgi:hypothetical protein
MVESICGQGFAYAREVEEDWTKELVKLGLEKATGETALRWLKNIFDHVAASVLCPFIGASWCFE